MKIAFHAPLKSPHHAVPSGDRLMARLVIAALERAGHTVAVASDLRTFSRDPSGGKALDLQVASLAEIDRISRLWQNDGHPDLWFCYHPYYKAPDLIGPALAHRFGMAYVTAEASYSRRRNEGLWADAQAKVLDAVRQASVNVCFTVRDRDGLLEAAPSARTAMLAPFIDPSAYLAGRPRPQSGRLVTVAMMRPGDKMDSYHMLAAALAHLADLPWTLSVIGDGPCKADVRALFAALPPERVIWHGEQTSPAIAGLLLESAICVWPGCGEAYGLAYLEAQASGVPVVAQAIAGVPEVVVDGQTGILTPPGDVAAFAGAIRQLLTQDKERERLARGARRFAGEERSLDRAALRLDAILQRHVGPAMPSGYRAITADDVKPAREHDPFAPLVAELDRWQAAGKVAAFWLRDDDAVEPTAALDRLLDMTARHAVPVALAVIPAYTGAALAARLTQAPLSAVLVHGWAHSNHAPTGEKKRELGGPGRTSAAVLDELAAGYARLSGLHEHRFVPVLVPPWNRIDAALVPRLGSLGFAALSVFGAEKAQGLPAVNSHVDVMDWHGTRGGRDPAVLVREIVRRLQHVFVHGGTVGVLTHHLVHDPSVWAFLERLFRVTNAHAGCRWSSLTALLPPREPT